MGALFNAYRAGLLGRNHWLSNIISGVIVGVVALPLAMAFAIASGAKPEQGIYTAIVAGLLVSVFGGTRQQIAGPTGAFIVILAGITAEYGYIGLQIATMMAGVILLLLGLARMGSIIKYIPAPVIVGFTSGIAVIIWVSQWKDFFGLPAVEAVHFHEKVWALIHLLPQFHLTTTLIALLSLAILLYSIRIPGLKKIPAPLTALFIATILQTVFEFDGVKTIGNTFGGIPLGLPNFEVPAITITQVITLIGPAFTIAMLGAIESLLSAVVADSMSGNRHDSNQELIGQGIANIATPLFGGFAATGAIARTATNIRNGGTSPLAGIIHSVTLILIILLLAPLAVNVPLAVMAAILFVVAWNMGEIKHFSRIIKNAPRADVAILLVTFALTIFVDLVVAVNIGVILATLHFLRRMAGSVEVRQTTDQELSQELSQQDQTILPAEIRVYSVEGPFFFGAVENFERALAGSVTTPEILIIRLGWVPFIDFTGLQTLEQMIKELHKRQVRVVITGANAKVTGKLKKAGIIALIGEHNFFSNFSDAYQQCRDDLAKMNPS